MLRNYLKIALRNIRRHRAYSFINILGLAIGLACFLLILVYIQNELGYDTFHKNADRIFRINTDLKFGSTKLALPLCSDMMGPTLKSDYPQIEEYTRFYKSGETKLVKLGNEYIEERNIAFVDSTFFKIFDFQAVSGKTSKALDEPNTVVITKSVAQKYFGSENASGKYIETDDNGSTLYKVSAVIEDVPANSHLKFNFLFPMKNLHYDWGNFVSLNFHTYLLLRKGINYKEFENNFRQYTEKYEYPYAVEHLQIGSKEEFLKAGNRIHHSLIPIADIHLYSKRSQEISPTGNIQYVYIFSAVAIFLMLIACINFMNLTTARSANRAREVGIRKVLGTQPKNLIFQFLTESIIMSAISVVIAFIFACFLLPVFGSLAGEEFGIKNLITPTFLIILLLLPVIVGLLAGSYPAIFLSRFLPKEILKGKTSLGSKSGGLRSALVVFQFSTSIILIACTIIVYRQLNYIQNKDLGYQKDQVLIINNAYALGNKIDAFKNEMLNVPGIKSATITGFLPIPSARNFSAFFKEAAMISQSGFTMQRWAIDYDYLKTLEIKLIEGRNFSQDFGTDTSSIILNEAAVKQMGFSEPLKEKIYTWVANDRVKIYNIIGVVKNFHFESMHQDIGSLCFVLQRNTDLCSFKVLGSNIPAILSEAERKWKSLSPEMPFHYTFMDQSFEEMYDTEKRVSKIAFSFSTLAILVACLGLFGLASFLAEQKTKEIGVRKVLGASIVSIILMLLKEFAKWLVLANLIAFPIAYYFMNKWLQDFVYRIDISWWIFVLSGGIALLIALFTVSYQAIKAATANPIKSLRYE